MKTLSVALIVSVVGLAFVLASPAEAAKTKAGKYKKSRVAVHTIAYRQGSLMPPAGVGFQGGVLAGPLYNGQDYIGDDPDPNIRAYLIRDMTRYGGPE